VPEALALIDAAGPLSDRLRGLVRVGERRWDLVLDRDQRILSARDRRARRALERVIALDEAQELLDARHRGGRHAQPRAAHRCG
jgi:cell division protein FtsQ